MFRFWVSSQLSVTENLVLPLLSFSAPPPCSLPPPPPLARPPRPTLSPFRQRVNGVLPPPIVFCLL
jgi:hypothetical protein